MCHEQTLDASTRERQTKKQEAREQRSRRREKVRRNLEAGEARSSETLKQTTSHTRSHTSSPMVFSFLPRYVPVVDSCKNPPEMQDSPISERALWKSDVYPVDIYRRDTSSKHYFMTLLIVLRIILPSRRRLTLREIST